ncbi:dystrotelin isoform X3 [Seriola aureovittata]|uniref:dystrotelin isoform X3 n=1 Tax=Seriola aureovittata TaxID=2871759 RepID=UPI0024BEB7F3|nr:dystrotelin isoform X3 [Seriola aureovittata]
MQVKQKVDILSASVIERRIDQTDVNLIMDLNRIEGLNEIRLSVYRAAMKLLSLQKLCHMHVVSVRHITAAVSSVGGTQRQDVGLNREEVTLTLNRMFHGVSQEVPGHVTMQAPEEMCSVMFRLYDRTQVGSVPAASLQTALIALSSDNLLEKYTALMRVSDNSSGSVSRSGLRALLQDLSQVPAAVQEEVIFGGVEAAVRSCFNGVLTSTASEEHVLSWLQTEPRLLLWLPTLYRLSISQNVSHTVRCHTCKTFPITGLRYRCMKCVKVHVCQSCFLTERHTRKHKTHHPVLEFCIQPTWRESLCSLVHSARHTLLPRRYTQREADRRRVLIWAEPGETRDSPSSNRDASHDASVRPPPSSLSLSKVVQTDEEMLTQQLNASAVLTEVRNLHRDKWLLEQEMQALRLTVQSEQGILEDRCSEIEVTMETLRQHNLRLQGMLTRAQRHANSTPHSVDMERGDVTPTSDTQRNTEEEEEEVLMKDESSEDEQQSPSPTIHQGTPLSHDVCCEEEGFAGDMCLCRPIGQEDRPEEAGLQNVDTCLSQEEEEEEEEEDCGMCSLEELLQEIVDGLKTVMETDRWRERQTGERKRVELLDAADQVGDCVHCLVDAVRTNAH